jgi:hypothetical protein
VGRLELDVLVHGSWGPLMSRARSRPLRVDPPGSVCVGGVGLGRCSGRPEPRPSTAARPPSQYGENRPDTQVGLPAPPPGAAGDERRRSPGRVAPLSGPPPRRGSTRARGGRARRRRAEMDRRGLSCPFRQVGRTRLLETCFDSSRVYDDHNGYLILFRS